MSAVRRVDAESVDRLAVEGGHRELCPAPRIAARGGAPDPVAAGPVVRVSAPRHDLGPVHDDRGEDRGEEVVRDPLPPASSVRGPPDPAHRREEHPLVVRRIDRDGGDPAVDVRRAHRRPCAAVDVLPRSAGAAGQLSVRKPGAAPLPRLLDRAVRRADVPEPLRLSHGLQLCVCLLSSFQRFDPLQVLQLLRNAVDLRERVLREIRLVRAECRRAGREEKHHGTERRERESTHEIPPFPERGR